MCKACDEIYRKRVADLKSSDVWKNSSNIQRSELLLAVGLNMQLNANTEHAHDIPIQQAK